MNTVLSLLERARKCCEPPTDYALAKRMGCAQSALTNIRVRGSAGQEMLARLCAVTGDDLGRVINAKLGERAKAAACIIGVIGLSSLATVKEAKAAVNINFFSEQIHIVSNVIKDLIRRIINGRSAFALYAR